MPKFVFMRDRDPRDDMRHGVGRYTLSTQYTNPYTSAQYSVRDKLLLAVTYVVRVQGNTSINGRRRWPA